MWKTNEFCYLLTYKLDLSKINLWKYIKSLKRFFACKINNIKTFNNKKQEVSKVYLTI